MSDVYLVKWGRRVDVSKLKAAWECYVKADFATLELLTTLNLRARCTAHAEIARRSKRGRLIPAKMLRTAGFKAPFGSYQEVRDGLYKWVPARTEAGKFFELWLTPASTPNFAIAGPLCNPQ